MKDERFHHDTVLVTGANGGLGTEFVKQFLAAGAPRVYATARTPREWDDPRVVALALDVTDEDSVARVAATASDVTLVINNAGIAAPAPLITGDMNTIRGIFETNLFGALHVARAFAPLLAKNTNGALVNVLSVLSWINHGGAYPASKAAFWSATNAIRLELDYAGVDVIGLVLGLTKTPMTKARDVEMNDPADVVRAALEGIDRRLPEIIVDAYSREIKQLLSGSVDAMYPEFR